MDFTTLIIKFQRQLYEVFHRLVIIFSFLENYELRPVSVFMTIRWRLPLYVGTTIDVGISSYVTSTVATG